MQGDAAGAAAHRPIAHEQGHGGSLIATGSVHSFTGVPGSAHYVAAKHGVAGLCKSMAIELARHKIRVNYVCPTALNTPLVELMATDAIPEGHGERIVYATGCWNLLDEGAPLVEAIEVTEAIGRVQKVDRDALREPRAARRGRLAVRSSLSSSLFR